MNARNLFQSMLTNLASTYKGLGPIITSRNIFLFACVLSIVVPPILMGPYLPIMDLLGFVGMHSYPGTLSSGPEHYYTVSFTYVLQHYMTRIMLAFGIQVPAQIVIYYLLQMLVFFYVVMNIIMRFTQNKFIIAFGGVLGCLALWERLFLIAGPGMTMLTMFVGLAVLLSIKELENKKSSALPVGVLAVLACISHPSAFIYLGILYLSRLLFLNSFRRDFIWLCVVGLLFVLLSRDFGEPSQNKNTLTFISNLFVPFPDIHQKMIFYFSKEHGFFKFLFGEEPSFFMSLIFYFLSSIKLLGVASAPYLFFNHKSSQTLKFCAFMGSIALLLLLFANPNEPTMPQWEDRPLLAFSWLTFSLGIVSLGLLANWVASIFPQLSSNIFVRLILIAIVLIVFVANLASQYQVFTHAKYMERSLLMTKEELLRNYKNSYVIMPGRFPGIPAFYLHGVEFLLFGDKDIIQNGILIRTHWHSLGRHNTRLVNAHNKEVKNYIAPPLSFRIKPDFTSEGIGYYIAGLSGEEHWGRWSDGKTVTIQTEDSKVLPETFTLKLDIFYIMGNNAQLPLKVQVGNQEQEILIPAPGQYELSFTNVDKANSIVLHIPNPHRPPSSSDTRMLGYGFASQGIQIVPTGK